MPKQNPHRAAPPHWLVASLLLLIFGGCNDESGEPPVPAAAPVAGAPTALPVDKDRLRAIEWDDLMPLDWQPEQALEAFDADELSDDDPRAVEMMAQLRTLWADAPVVAALDGQLVRLPGFVLPLQDSTDVLDEFLLVPYFGACIHVPPPPPNQTIRVVLPAGRPLQAGLFETVWVEGRLRIERFSHALGDAAWRLDATVVTPYLDDTGQ